MKIIVNNKLYIQKKVDYTPDIADIIKKIFLINKNNSLDFIQDDLLD